MSTNHKFAGIRYDQQSVISSDVSKTHINEECILIGVLIGTDGTNQVTLNIYDGLNNSGNQLYTPNIIILGSSSLVYIAPEPFQISTGVHVTVDVANGGTCYHRIFYDK